VVTTLDEATIPGGGKVAPGPEMKATRLLPYKLGVKLSEQVVPDPHTASRDPVFSSKISM
jgi:hypothetical protein